MKLRKHQVPKEWRDKTEDELRLAQKGHWNEREMATLEFKRRDAIKNSRRYVEEFGPRRIAEYESEIGFIRDEMAKEQKMIAKLEKVPK